MATQRQKRVAKLIIENATLDKPLNGAQIVEKSSYSKAVQIKPGQVLNSTGVKEELEVLGFTPDNAKKVVSEILNNIEVEPNARLKAADMTFKVHGTYAPEKSVTLNIEAKVDDNDLNIAKQLLEQRSNQRGSEGGSIEGNGVVSEPLGRKVQDQK